MLSKILIVKHMQVFFVIPTIAWVEEDSANWSYQLSWLFWSFMVEFQRKEP